MKCFLFVLALFSSTIINGQTSFKKSYKILDWSFEKTFTFSSGNALISCDLNKLISHLSKIEKSNNYGQPFQVNLHKSLDTLQILSKLNDTVNGAFIMDNAVSDLIEMYLVDCIVKKQVSILDKRYNKKANTIYTKKFNEKGDGPGCKWSGYDFYLPNDKVKFISGGKMLVKYVKLL